MKEDITHKILKKLQAGQTDIKAGLKDVRTDFNMQFAALNEKLSGQLISEIEFRAEMQRLRERLDRVETRLELKEVK